MEKIIVTVQIRLAARFLSVSFKLHLLLKKLQKHIATAHMENRFHRMLTNEGHINVYRHPKFVDLNKKNKNYYF